MRTLSKPPEKHTSKPPTSLSRDLTSHARSKHQQPHPAQRSHHSDESRRQHAALHARHADHGRRTGTTRRRAAARTPRARALRRGRDSLSAVPAGLGDEATTGAAAALRGLEFRRALEVARALGPALGEVVLVEDEGELLGGVAHAVGAVGALLAVGGDAGAGLRVLPADVAEERAVFGLGEGGVDDAGEGLRHAGAEFLVGGRGERGGCGVPVAVCGRTGGGGVAGLVGVHLHARGVGFGDLGFVVVEVGEGGDGVAVDGDEAWHDVSDGSVCFAGMRLKNSP